MHIKKYTASKTFDTPIIFLLFREMAVIPTKNPSNKMLFSTVACNIQPKLYDVNKYVKQNLLCR